MKRNLNERVDRALRLSAATSTEFCLRTDAKSVADETWSAQPVPRNRLAQREIELQAALAEASAMLAYLADTTVTIPT